MTLPFDRFSFSKQSAGEDPEKDQDPSSQESQKPTAALLAGQ
jgi:hypothetical protein